MYGAFAPGVEAFPRDRELLYRRGADAQLRRRQRVEPPLVAAGRQREAADGPHEPSLPARQPLAQAHWRL